MKYAIVILAGAADEPVAELNQRTPLQAAELPHLDELAGRGRLGTTYTVPEDHFASTETTVPNVLGYDPLAYSLPRGALEALARGIRLDRNDRVLRCNLVTVLDGVLRDLAAGYIRTPEATRLINDLAPLLPQEGMELHAGRSFRHLLVWRNAGALSRLRTLPPHACLDEPVRRHLPSGREAGPLLTFLERADKLLDTHDVNTVRQDLGENPASGVWLWGGGAIGAFPSFETRFGLRGAAVAGVDFVRGLAKLLRWDVCDVPGATGLVDTDLSAKGAAAAAALDGAALVCVHIEACDEAGHMGDASLKLRLLEAIDRDVIGPVLRRLRDESRWRMLVIPDHATPVSLRTHTAAAVPFVLAGSDIDSHRGEVFDEHSAREGEMQLEHAWHLMEYFLRR